MSQPTPLKIAPISQKSTNCYTWTGEQCVATFLADIRAGTINPAKIMIVWFSQDADGSLHPHRWFAQIDRCEGIALLDLAKHIAIEEWKQSEP